MFLDYPLCGSRNFQPQFLISNVSPGRSRDANISFIDAVSFIIYSSLRDIEPVQAYHRATDSLPGVLGRISFCLVARALV
ncbi:hypothetical protein DSUL_90072 [Desulfovibrionales bacterium]